MFIPFGSWRPDLADDQTGVTDALNVIPAYGSYAPVRGLSPRYTALEERCIGAFSCKSSFGETFWFAGTPTLLYGLSAGTDDWVRLVRTSGSDTTGFSQVVSCGRTAAVVHHGHGCSTNIGRPTVLLSEGVMYLQPNGSSVSGGFGSVPIIIPDQDEPVLIPPIDVDAPTATATATFGIPYRVPPAEPLLLIDDLIQEHGKYSNTYQSDWTDLPDGKNWPRKAESDYTFISVVGELFDQQNQHGYRRTYSNQANVVIENIAVKVSWNGAYNGLYATCLFNFKNCTNVTVRNVAVINMNSDWRAGYIFFFESCVNVNIQNCYFSGAEHDNHVYAKECATVFMNNIEITGRAYPGTNSRAGRGIYVNNGNSALPDDGAFPPAHELQWCVIQNCYIHDYDTQPAGTRGADAVSSGIAVTSGSECCLFNNYVENWHPRSDYIGTSYDISHRRDDAAYRNHIIRMERNVAKQCQTIKSPGGPGHSSNRIYWFNNLIIDTELYDYHDNAGLNIYYAYNTWISTPNRRVQYMAYIQGMDGNALFYNNLFHVWTSPVTSVWHGTSLARLSAENNMYMMPTPSSTFAVNIGDFATWRASGRDSPNGWLITNGENPFVSRTTDNFRINANSSPDGTASDMFLSGDAGTTCTQDYYGKPRSAGSVSIGACEP